MQTGTGQTQSAVLNTGFSHDPQGGPTMTSMMYLSLARSMNLYKGQNSMQGHQRSTAFDWQERDEAVALIGSSMTNWHFESVVIQRSSSAICQHTSADFLPLLSHPNAVHHHRHIILESLMLRFSLWLFTMSLHTVYTDLGIANTTTISM